MPFFSSLKTKMAINRALCLVFFLLMSWPVQAAQFSSQYLLQVCERDENGAETTAGGHAVCQSYIAGVIDYNNLIKTLGTAPSVNFCVTDQVDIGDLHTIVLEYLRAHIRAHKDFLAAPAVALALYEAYPCP